MEKNFDTKAEVCGIVILDKGEGLTSQTAVNRVKRLFSAKKAGHTGTLDPMATGVLPVLVGRAVKASEYMISSKKHYRATLLLGITTDTEDSTGKTLTTCEEIPDEEKVLSACAAMVGESMQTPPMYSAIKVDGVTLMERARRGEVIERESRPICVYSLKAKKLSLREYELDVECSKGTYIRTLCADIGKSLGCGGVMSALRRCESAGFSLDCAHTIEEFEGMTEQERMSCVLPVESIFSHLVSVELPSFFATLAKNGGHIYQKKIKTDIPLGEQVRLYDEHGFFALGEVRSYEDGATAIKPVKSFR